MSPTDHEAQDDPAPTPEKPTLSDEEKKQRREKYRRARRERVAKIDVEDLPEVLTVDEAAVLYQVDPKTIRELFRAGKLPGRKLGSKIIRFHREELLEWVRGEGCVSHKPRKAR